jgi:hypothetical protein
MAPVSKNTITARPLGEIPVDQPQLRLRHPQQSFELLFFECYYDGGQVADSLDNVAIWEGLARI